MIFGVGEKSISKENSIFENYANMTSIDYLLFFDSRGLTINEANFKESHLYSLIKSLKNAGKSFLAISRPKNLTTFATLYNFLKLNPELHFSNLITNLGFVDCTPKKEVNIQDLEMQITQFHLQDYTIKRHETYQLSDGSYEKLQNLEYSDCYLHNIAYYLKQRFTTLYFINTPLLDANTALSRQRPSSFFIQLASTNALIEKMIELSSSILIDVKDINMTYDGVHYTVEGHKLLFERIIECIKI